jgi:hypothetical protein
MKQKAWKLVQKGWTQKAMARTKGGKPCSLKDAAKVCLAGAVLKVYGIAVMNLFNESFARSMGMGPVTWNDIEGRTKREVIQLLKEYNL